MDAYEIIAQYYDLEFADFTADIELYLAFAQRTGGPILELGCGTGRLLEPLARAGYEVHGVDRSAAMLARARDRLTRAGVQNVRLYQADFRELHELPAETFRLAIATVNSFLHLPDRASHSQALVAIHRVLRTGGLLILDLLHPTPEQLRLLEQPLAHDGHWTLPDGSRLDRFATRTVHPAEQTIVVTLFYDRSDPATGVVTRRVAEYTLRYVHRFELELLLERAGFRVEAIYGSYDLEPLRDDSLQMLVVAERQSAILAQR